MKAKQIALVLGTAAYTSFAWATALWHGAVPGLAALFWYVTVVLLVLIVKHEVEK